MGRCWVNPHQVQREQVMDWFDGVKKFEAFHQGVVDERMIRHLIEDDFETLIRRVVQNS